MTTIHHLSDHHGNINRLRVCESGIVVVTGDMLPNACTMDERVELGDDWREAEVSCQSQYVIDNADAFRTSFGSCPVVVVNGNHDFIDFASALRGIGINAVSVEDGVQVVGGLRFAGFRHVRMIVGDWEGEVSSFDNHVEQVMSQNPDVLVVHSPVDGILSDDHGCGHGRGINMHGQLFYGDHNIKVVCHGHVHTMGGQTVEHGGITFSNAANTVNTVEV